MKNCILFLGFELVVVVTSFAAVEPLPPLPDGAFTYVVIPDTQRYAGEGAYVRPGEKPQTGPTTNAPFASRVSWLAQNLDNQNVAFVTHVGDIVDKDYDLQWTFASELMSKLDGRVKYDICPGNHDMADDANDYHCDTRRFVRYFPVERFKCQGGYVGHFNGIKASRGFLKCAGNANTVRLFEAGGMKFVVAHVECNAPEPVLKWVDEMFWRYSDRHAIFATHAYLGPKTLDIRMSRPPIAKAEEERTGHPVNPYAPEMLGRMQWISAHEEEGDGLTGEEMWTRHLSKHRNLFLVVCGDQSGVLAYRQQSVGRYGNVVSEIMQDYPRSDDACDWIRLFRFLPRERRILVYTYSPSAGGLPTSVKFKTERSDHQFEIPFPGNPEPPCKKYWPPLSEEAKELFRKDPQTLPLPAGLADEPEPDAKVVYRGNVPKILVNGRTHDAELVMEYLDDESKWAADAIAHFRDAGSHIFRIRTGTWHQPDGGPYDFSDLDKQARRLLSVDPDARIELIVRLEMPEFCKAHPEDTIRYGVPGEVKLNSNDYKGFPLRGSPASAAYRAECVRILEALCRTVRESPWGKRVILVRPCWGVTTEWHFYGFWNAPGMCGPMSEAFHRWKDGRWAGASVPTAVERTHDGFLLDPKTDRKTLDFFRMMQEQVVGLAHLMARTIKANLPGRLVGIYYGYVMTAQAPEGANVLLDEMLSSPDIDFLSNPCHYNKLSRRNGGSFPQRTIPSFYRRRGKLCILEDDTRFHFIADFDPTTNPTETPEESRAVMRRNYLNTVFDGCGIQLCDSTFGCRGRRPYTFDNPDVIRAIRDAKAAIAKAGRISETSGNEVALVVDYRERLRWDGRGAWHHSLGSRLYDRCYLALTRCGVPADLIELRDFLADGPRHKYVIFLNLFGPNAEVRVRLKELLAERGVTAIWMVAPGCVTPDGFSDAAMSDLTEMRLEGAGPLPDVKCTDEASRAFAGLDGIWEKRRADGGRSFFVSKPIVEEVEWARFFDGIGAHRYVEPGVCFRRQGDVFMLHVGKAGAYDISFPKDDAGRYVELFTGRSYEGRRLSVCSDVPETWFFRRVCESMSVK